MTFLINQSDRLKFFFVQKYNFDSQNSPFLSLISIHKPDAQVQ